MSGFNRQYLGSVKIVGGKLLIMDTKGLGVVKEIETEAKVAVSNEDCGGPVLGGAAVVFEPVTPVGVDEVAVFATYNRAGDIARIEIKVSDDEDEES